MRSVLFVAIHSLKKNKKQLATLFIGVFFASVLLVVAMQLKFGLNDSFEQSYIEAGGPHVRGLYNDSIVSKESLAGFLNGAGAETVNFFPLYDISSISSDTSDSSIQLPTVSVMDETNGANTVISPEFVDAQVRSPDYGEVLIPQKTANALNVGVGDTIHLQRGESATSLTVAGIITDLVFSAPISSIHRIFVNGNQARTEFVAKPGYAFEAVFAGDIPNGNVLYADFIEYLGSETAPLGFFYTFENIRASYTTVYTIVGLMLFFLAILGSLIVLMVLGFAAKGAVLADTRKIGVMRAMGFTTANVMSIYALRYGIVSLLGAILGASSGILMSKLLFTALFAVMPNVIMPSIELYATFTVIGVVLFSSCILFFATRDIAQLNTIDAIRNKNGEFTVRKSLIAQKVFLSNIHVSLKLAVNSMMGTRLKSLVTVAGAVFLCAIMVFAFGMITAAARIDTNPENWGLTNQDIFIIPLDDVDARSILADIESDPDVLYTYGGIRNSLSIKAEGTEDFMPVDINVHELPLDERVIVHYYEGRMPQGDEEVGVSYGLATSANLSVGDTLTVDKYGTIIQTTIVGIYPSFIENSISMTTEDIKAFFLNTTSLGYYNIILKDGVDKYAVTERFKKTYSDFNFLPLGDQATRMVQILLPIFAALILAISIILYISVSNLTMLNILKERRSIGILAAGGFDKGSIVFKFLAQNISLSSLGIVFGLFLGIFGLPALMTSVFSSAIGLAKTPFMPTIEGALVAGLLTSLLYLLSTLITARHISATDSRTLLRCD